MSTRRSISVLEGLGGGVPRQGSGWEWLGVLRRRLSAPLLHRCRRPAPVTFEFPGALVFGSSTRQPLIMLGLRSRASKPRGESLWRAGFRTAAYLRPALAVHACQSSHARAAPPLHRGRRPWLVSRCRRLFGPARSKGVWPLHAELR